MLRSLLALACFLLPAFAVAQSRPPQAPDFAGPSGVCQCTGKSDCTCPPDACFCRACSGRKAVVSATTAATLTAAQAPQAYTATFYFGQTAEAKTYETPPIAIRFGVPDMRATPDQPIPAGTYRVTLVPMQAPTAPPARRAFDATVYRDPTTGQRWQYTDAAGNWRVLAELPSTFAATCADGSCGVSLFGGGDCASGSCGTQQFSGGAEYSGGGACAGGSCGTGRGRSFGLFRRR